MRIIGATPTRGSLSPSQSTICLEGYGEGFGVEFEYDIVERKPGERRTNSIMGDASPKSPRTFASLLRLGATKKDLVRGVDDQREKAPGIYRLITRSVHYSYVPEPCLIGNISGYAATNLRGDCGVHALSFVAMCRVLGFPSNGKGAGSFCPPVPALMNEPRPTLKEAGFQRTPSFSSSRRSDEVLNGFCFGGLDAFCMIAN